MRLSWWELTGITSCSRQEGCLWPLGSVWLGVSMTDVTRLLTTVSVWLGVSVTDVTRLLTTVSTLPGPDRCHHWLHALGSALRDVDHGEITVGWPPPSATTSPRSSTPSLLGMFRLSSTCSGCPRHAPACPTSTCSGPPRNGLALHLVMRRPPPDRWFRVTKVTPQCKRLLGVCSRGVKIVVHCRWLFRPTCIVLVVSSSSLLQQSDTIQ